MQDLFYMKKAAVKMCIRDRVNTVSPIHIRQDSIAHNLVAKFVKMDGEKENITVYGDTPVSYTHLDVYKRQLMDRSGKRIVPQASIGAFLHFFKVKLRLAFSGCLEAEAPCGHRPAAGGHHLHPQRDRIPGR